MRVNAVIQARLSSSRLPGKVLRDLAGRSVLSWVVRAAQQAPGMADVVVATSDAVEDDAVADEAKRCGALVVRGPLDDVLDRFAVAVAEHPCDAIVRLTADCPLLDPDVIGQVIAVWRADPSLQYVSNILVRTFPRGLDTELVRADVLAEQVEHATGADRVHVTSGIYADPARYRCAGVVVAPAADDLRITMDAPQDAAVIEGVVAELGDRAPSWREVVRVLRERPELAARNANVRQKDVAQG